MWQNVIEEKDPKEELLQRICYAILSEEKERAYDRVEFEDWKDGKLVLRRGEKIYAVSIEEV